MLEQVKISYTIFDFFCMELEHETHSPPMKRSIIDRLVLFILIFGGIYRIDRASLVNIANPLTCIKF
jgi:hypothetical protein